MFSNVDEPNNKNETKQYPKKNKAATFPNSLTDARYLLSPSKSCLFFVVSKRCLEWSRKPARARIPFSWPCKKRGNFGEFWPSASPHDLVHKNDSAESWLNNFTSWWFFTNPFEHICGSQNGSFPQGVQNNENISNHHPYSFNVGFRLILEKNICDFSGFQELQRNK